ncbi:MAG: MBL fold metallo-hydrolase [Chloroflexi bacterium]|nr:MBL fold metallo-hydrolase [Chloroflexota bacterium]
MKLTFHGAAQTVTGSQHLLQVNGQNILLDCGLFQGRRAESYERNLNFPFRPQEIDVLVLSHAHIDHSGNIPNLVKQGFQGDIVCTSATQDLCGIMLRDSGRIQEGDANYVSKQGRKRNLPPVEPIYTEEDAAESLRNFVGIGYKRPYKLAPGITLSFYDAGHILGSAMVKLEIEEHTTKKLHTLIFSGDIGRYGRPILGDPTTFSHADVVIMESTYGSRDHEVESPDNDQLRDVVNRTYQRGGKIIVPAFAVGRTQELVYRLHELIRAGEIPRLPIFVDSPLAINATEIYRVHPEAFDAEMANLLLQGHDPFGSNTMHYTRSSAESKNLNNLQQPAVIISASGMMEAGRILHHLAHNIENPRNTILVVGWQAAHTLGRKLVDGLPQVNILGDRRDVRAEVAVLNGFSGHAGRSELLAWAGAFNKPPQHTFLVHGEEESAESLASALRYERFPNVHVPSLDQSFEL